MNFSEKIRKILFERNMNQADLAKLVGTSETTVSRWLKGVKPRERMMKMLSIALEIPLETLGNNSFPISKELDSKSNEVWTSKKGNIINGDEAMNSVEDLFGTSFTRNERILLNIIQRYIQNYYDEAMNYAKENNAMDIATAIMLFKELKKTNATFVDIKTGKFFSNGIEQ